MYVPRIEKLYIGFILEHFSEVLSAYNKYRYLLGIRYINMGHVLHEFTAQDKLLKLIHKRSGNTEESTSYFW
jgi:hypothetical protein